MKYETHKKLIDFLFKLVWFLCVIPFTALVWFNAGIQQGSLIMASLVLLCIMQYVVLEIVFSERGLNEIWQDR